MVAAQTRLTGTKNVLKLQATQKVPRTRTSIKKVHQRVQTKDQRAKREIQCRSLLKGCTQGRRRATLFALPSTWAHASKEQHALANTFVRCRAVTRLTLRQSINDRLIMLLEVRHKRKKRKLQPLDVEHRSNSDGVKPQLGESGFFCLELFCGTPVQ